MINVKYLSERNILTVLRIAPIIAVPLVVGLIIFTLYINNQNRNIKDIETLKNDFIKSEKKFIQNEVLKTRELIQIKQDSSRARLKKRIRSQVYEGYAIANSIYQNNKDKKSAKEIQHLIVDALINVRFFDGRGYYFINNNNGKAVLFSGKSKLDMELNLSSWEDIKGNHILQDQIDVIRSKGEGFNTKFHRKLDIGDTKDTKEYEKISFVKNFAPYDWHIGTGDYLYNEQRTIQEEILEEMTAIGKLKETSNETSNYMIIMHVKGNTLYHSDSNLINTNADDFKDTNGRSVGKEILNMRSASYMKYFYKNPTTGRMSEKISYFVYIPKWEWLVGSDFYIDKMKEVLDKETKKLETLNESNLFYISFFGLIVFFISIFISIFISKTIKNIFDLYQNKITNQVNELKNLNATLESRVVEAIKDVKQKDEQLLQHVRLAQMGEMISMIAHQWRQPLGAISATSINLRMRIMLEAFDLNKEEGRKECQAYFTDGLKDIEIFTQSLTTTIDDFKNFYKPNKQADLVSFYEPVSKALNIIRGSLISDGIEIVEPCITCNNKRAKIYTNELMQVILNILKNAQDNFKEKKIKDPEITITCKCDSDDKIILDICDNGGGIPEEIIDKIFDPYFSTKNELNGTGLGLYMSKTIVEEHHNGNLLVNNSKDGVCFTIELAQR
ncbi:sensor histidine kinase [Candidatus Sulfurimonas marisnigri]|nr:cache domain-containing protein [Candidatus Sulfurimonas marisnigri]